MAAADPDSQVLEMLRDLYPHASAEQLAEGKQNLEEYLEVAWDIAERLVHEAHKSAFDADNENPYDEKTKVDSPPSLTKSKTGE